MICLLLFSFFSVSCSFLNDDVIPVADVGELDKALSLTELNERSFQCLKICLIEKSTAHYKRITFREILTD